MSSPVFSVGLPQTLSGADPRPIATYATRAEALGFVRLWTLDSAVGGPTSRTPLLDGLQVLAHVAAVPPKAQPGVPGIGRGRRGPALPPKEPGGPDPLPGGGLPAGVGMGAPADERVAALGFPTD